MDSSSSKSTSLSSLVHQFFVLGNNHARLSLEQQVQVLKTHPDGITLALNLILHNSQCVTSGQRHPANFATLPPDFPLPSLHLNRQECKLSVDPALQQQPYLVFVVLGVLQDSVWKYLYSPPSLQQYFYLGIVTLLFATPSIVFPAFVKQKATSLLADLLLCEWSQQRALPLAWLTQQLPCAPPYVHEVLALALCVAQKCSALDTTHLLAHETQRVECAWREAASQLEQWVCECLPPEPKSTHAPYPSPISPTDLPAHLVELGLSILQFLPAAPCPATVRRVQALCRAGSALAVPAFETFHAWLAKPSLPVAAFRDLLEHTGTMLAQPQVYFADAAADPDTAVQAWLHLVHPLAHQHLTRMDPALLCTWLETLAPYWTENMPEEMLGVVETIADFLSTHALEEAVTSSAYLPASCALFDRLFQILQWPTMPRTLAPRYIGVLEKLVEAFPAHFRPQISTFLEQCLVYLVQASEGPQLESGMHALGTGLRLVAAMRSSGADATADAQLVAQCTPVADLLLAHFDCGCARETACAFFALFSRGPALDTLPSPLPALLHRALVFSKDADTAVAAAQCIIQDLRAPAPSLSPSLFPPAVQTPTSPLFPHYVHAVYLTNPGQAAALLTCVSAGDRARYAEALTLVLPSSAPKQVDAWVQSSGILAQLQEWAQGATSGSGDPAVLVDIFCLLLTHQVKSLVPSVLEFATRGVRDLDLFCKLSHVLLETRSVPASHLPTFAEFIFRRIQENPSLLSPEIVQLLNLLLLHYWTVFFTSNVRHSQEHLRLEACFFPIFECLFQCMQRGDVEVVRTALKGLKDVQAQWRIFHKELWKQQMYTLCLPILLRPLVQPDLHLLLDDLADVLKSVLEAGSASHLPEWSERIQGLIAAAHGVDKISPFMSNLVSEGVAALQDLASFELNLKALARNIKCISGSL